MPRGEKECADGEPRIAEPEGCAKESQDAHDGHRHRHDPPRRVQGRCRSTSEKVARPRGTAHALICQRKILVGLTGFLRSWTCTLEDWICMRHEVVVPDRAFPVLRKLSQLEESDQGKLGDALLEKSGFDSPSVLADFLRGLLPDAWTESELARLVSEIFSISNLLEAHEQTVESAASAVAATEGLEISQEARDGLRTVLEFLLSSHAITNLSNAASVYAEHDRLWVDGNLYVDARPVFSLVERETVGAVLTTKLRISYFSNGSVKEFEVALESDNVSALLKALERSQTESAKWSELLESAGKTVFRFDASGD